jgi:hypothetical protein
MTDRIRCRIRCAGLLILVAIGLTRPLLAQDARDALVARAFTEFDAARRMQLLRGALNPTSGPPRGAWALGVQLLAQTLIEEHQDSLAALWLRWAVRLAPDLQPDTVQFLPQVAAAYTSARMYVAKTRSAADSTTATTWLWGPSDTTGRMGGIQIAASAEPIRLDIHGAGLIAPGARMTLSPGSYEIAASSANTNLLITREILPGVTTVLEFRTAPTVAAVPSILMPAVQDSSHKTPEPIPQATAVPVKKGGGFPVWLAVVGGVGAAGAAVALAGKKSKGPPPPTTGTIVIPFPNP